MVQVTLPSQSMKIKLYHLHLIVKLLQTAEGGALRRLGSKCLARSCAGEGIPKGAAPTHLPPFRLGFSNTPWPAGLSGMGDCCF